MLLNSMNRYCACTWEANWGRIQHCSKFAGCFWSMKLRAPNDIWMLWPCCTWLVSAVFMQKCTRIHLFSVTSACQCLQRLIVKQRHPKDCPCSMTKRITVAAIRQKTDMLYFLTDRPSATDIQGQPGLLVVTTLLELAEPQFAVG